MKPFTAVNYLSPDERKLILKISELVKDRKDKGFQFKELWPDCTNFQLMRKWREKGWVKIIGNVDSCKRGGASIRIWALTDKANKHIKAYKDSIELPAIHRMSCY